MNIKRAIRFGLFTGAATLGAFALCGCAADSSSAAAGDPNAKFAFWPTPQVSTVAGVGDTEPRIQFLGSFNSSEDVSATKSTGLERIVFGAEAVRPAVVNKPYGVAIRDGKIYVCDIRAKALVVMDLGKKQTRLVGTTGTNRLERPVAVAVADDGQLYVADGIHAAIFVFDASERFSKSIVIPKLKPASIAIAGQRIYVADMGRQQILVLDRGTGKELGAIGTIGDEDGQFRLPIGVATDKAGNIYVADMMRCKVQKFSPEGTFLAAVGEQGDHAGGFARPKHLAVDSDGIVYVVDSGFQNVQMFNASFQLLMHFGAAGEFPGAMNLPVGVAVTDTGIEYFQNRMHPGFQAKRLVVVASQFGDSKISVYALGDRRSNFSLASLSKSAQAVQTGVGEPTAETLKFQNIGGVEPGQEGAPADAAKQDPAQPQSPAPAQPPKK